MKKIFQIALGIVTSVGGFLEIGSITTAAQAGASFGYQLVWSIVLGTVCVAFLVEMSGRFAAVSKHTIPDAMRERFGINFYVVPLFVLLGVSLLVLGAELGGVAAALEMATGIKLPVWAIPVALLSWGLLWRASFSVIENGVSILGLVTVAFAVGAVKLHPDYGAVLHGVVPTLPRRDASHYWFVAVSVLGASISPYLYYFYSSGAIEEKWDETYLAANRMIAAIGMSFGGFLSVAVLVLAAILFHPHNIDVDKYQQLPDLLTPIFGRSGFWLVIASLGIACLGATLEISLALAYLIAQGFGWNWGEDLGRSDRTRSTQAHPDLDGAHRGVAAGRCVSVSDPDERQEVSADAHERLLGQRGRARDQPDLRRVGDRIDSTRDPRGLTNASRRRCAGRTTTRQDR
jgi:Mn2+/Fe2+ NRAMP family transporter